MRFAAALALLFAFATCSNALHFYLEVDEKRCFVEELPSDTVVEGADTLCPHRMSYICPELVASYLL